MKVGYRNKLPELMSQGEARSHWGGLSERKETAQHTKPALAAASMSPPSDPTMKNAVGLERPPLVESGVFL